MRNIDFYDFDSVLAEEQILVRDTVRTFVNEQVLPNIGQWCAEGVFPGKLIEPIGEMGLLGSTLPEEYGGAGLDSLSYGLIMQELERGDSGLRSFASVQGALVMYPIFSFGSEEQKQKYLPMMASGELIGCFGLTEPDGGSNPADMRTTAKKVDGGWLLNGTKIWITNATMSGAAVVFAQTGDTHRDIRGFIVDSDTGGFTANPIRKKIGLKPPGPGIAVSKKLRTAFKPTRTPNRAICLALDAASPWVSMIKATNDRPPTVANNSGESTAWAKPPVGCSRGTKKG